MSPGSGPLTIPATGPKARAAWSGRGGFQTRPYVFSSPSMVSLVIGCPRSSQTDHCIIATFSQTGHMAVENNPGGPRGFPAGHDRFLPTTGRVKKTAHLLPCLSAARGRGLQECSVCLLVGSRSQRMSFPSVSAPIRSVTRSRLSATASRKPTLTPRSLPDPAKPRPKLW